MSDEQTATTTNEAEYGPTVYTEDGTECALIARVGDGAVVESIMVNEEGDADYGHGRRFYAEKVYATPPSYKLDAMIAENRQTLASLKDQVFALRHEIATAERTRKDLLTKIQQVPTLQRLSDFLDGKLTHLVYEDYSGVSIGPIDAEQTDDCGSYQKHIRLLTLFGRNNGNIGWGLNRYSDGSGSDTVVYPCVSEEDAKAKAAQVLTEKFDECRKSPHKSGLSYLLASALSLGVEPPKDLKDWHDAKELENATRLVEVARKTLADREAFLATRKGAPQ